jgi:protein-disulfide isomerase
MLELKKSWIDTGKARFVFRDFPLDGLAVSGAVLARCAPPETFYGFVDVLFETQHDWARSGDPAGLEPVAKLGGIGADEFKACMTDDALLNKILDGRRAAEHEFKIDSTPTFIINGRMLVGALHYQDLDDTLKQVSPKP